MVALHTIRIELEPVAAVLVAEGVEDEGDTVGCEIVIAVHYLVASRERRADALRAKRVIHAGADVDRGRIVQDPNLGFLARGLAFVRLRLGELGDGRRGGPRLFVDLPIDGDLALPQADVGRRSRIAL